VDCFIPVIECEGPRPSYSIDDCMCSVDGHCYTVGTCFGLHYKALYMSSIARPLGQVRAGKDLGRNTTKSTDLGQFSLAFAEIPSYEVR